MLSSSHDCSCTTVQPQGLKSSHIALSFDGVPELISDNLHCYMNTGVCPLSCLLLQLAFGQTDNKRGQTWVEEWADRLSFGLALQPTLLL